MSQSWSVLTDLSGKFPQVQDLQSVSRLGFERHQLLSSLHGHNTNLRRIYRVYTTEADESTCWVFICLKNTIIVTDPLKHSRFEAGQGEPSRHSGRQRRTSRARLRPDDQRTIRIQASQGNVCGEDDRSGRSTSGLRGCSVW